MWVLGSILGVLLLLVLWNALAWPRVGAATRLADSAVSVLIPARDEESNIDGVLASALAQGAAVGEILVYDDHSCDRTAELVRAVAGRSDRVRLIAPVPLPAGWCGKSFACSRLAEEARGDWLLFLDADARLLPGAAGRARTEAEQRGVTLLSCWPGLDMGGFWERLFMPMLNFVVLSLFPAPLSLRSRLPALGLAHGACILIRRDAYLRTGGHALVRGELFEDTALARAWRRAGERGLCLDGQDVVRVRMYDSLSGIWSGFEKNSYPAFQRESSFWLFVLLHGALLWPFVLMPATGAGGVAAAMIVSMRLILAVRFRHPWWSAFLHPVAEAGLIAVCLRSWVRCRSGVGVAWKGRTYRGAVGRDV